MEQTDAKYYTDQINSFTAFQATEKKNAISVLIDGKLRPIKTENEADRLLKELSNKSSSEL